MTNDTKGGDQAVLAVGATVIDGMGASGAASATLAVANALRGELTRRRDAREAFYLSRVAEHLAAGDPVAAARLAGGEVVRPGFVEALERGYEHLRRSFDSLAQECICILVAEHGLVSDGRKPREFAQVGTLLEQNDSDALRSLCCVVSWYQAFVGAGESKVTVFELTQSGRFFLAERRRWGELYDAESTAVHAGMHELARHGLGRLWSGFGTTPPNGAPRNEPSTSCYLFTEEHRSGMLLLWKCLAPVRISQPPE